MSLSKAKALGERAAQFHERFNRDVDSLMLAYDNLDALKKNALDKHHALIEAHKADIAESAEAVAQLTNLPLDSHDRPPEAEKS